MHSSILVTFDSTFDDLRESTMKSKAVLTAACLCLALGTGSRAQEVVRSDVRAFIDGLTLVGPTRESYKRVADEYDSSVVPDVVRMLNMESEDARPHVAAFVLGVVGDERAVEALIAYVEKPVTQPISRAQHNGRGAAITALGTLVNRTGSERALQYLIDGLTPSVWRQRNVEGVSASATSYDEYDLQLSKYALFGLAMSGSPKAGDALRRLDRSPTPAQLRFRNGIDDVLKTWLEVHALVAEKGIEGMYEHYETQAQLKEEQDRKEAQRLREEKRESEQLREAQQPPGG
jgi:HEAT repeat protein